MQSVRIWRRSIALPSDHGSWVFLLSPLLIGIFAGGAWSTPSFYLVVAALAGFLARQPLTVAAKVLGGRRPRDDLTAAAIWLSLYGGVGLLHAFGLVIRGYGYVLWLALPGIPVFVWYLALVARRAERRQRLIEVLATGAMGLAAPAAMWIGLGRPDPLGWLLWILVWAQTAASILHAYLRLGQRTLPATPDLLARLRFGREPLLVTLLNVSAVLCLGRLGLVSRWLFVAFAVQLAETLYGTLAPAIGVRPRTIGFRQLAVSVLFTVLFILLWPAG
jgi:hypothetical protein